MAQGRTRVEFFESFHMTLEREACTVLVSLASVAHKPVSASSRRHILGGWRVMMIQNEFPRIGGACLLTEP